MAFASHRLSSSVGSFLSILLPGALLAYLGMDWITDAFLARGLYGRDGWEEWIVFLFVAYLLGHVVNLIGSGLDEVLEAPLRSATHAGQVRSLARGSSLADVRVRRLAESRWLFGSTADEAGRQAETIRRGDLGDARAIDGYQWAKIRLSREHPEALAAVEGLEIEARLFRGFAVALALLVPVFLWNLRLTATVLCALLVIPALWRYLRQRSRAGKLAAWHLMGLHHADQLAGRVPADRVTGSTEFTHAAGVVYRQGPSETEFLLVATGDDDGEWVLPGGRTDPGETAAETAVREVLAAGGVWARVISPAGEMDEVVNGAPIAVRVFLMEALEPDRADREDEERTQRRWLPASAAIAAATHEEARRVLAASQSLPLYRRPPSEHEGR